MISPDKVSTGIYARLAKYEYAGISAASGLSAVATAAAAGMEGLNTVEGKGLTGVTIVLGSVAIHALNTAFKYSVREGQLDEDN